MASGVRRCMRSKIEPVNRTYARAWSTTVKAPSRMLMHRMYVDVLSCLALHDQQLARWV